MAFITAETRSSIVELAMGMLNQAPSSKLLTTLIGKSTEGASLQDLADYIATTDAFTAEYPATQTAREFATEMFGKLITGGTLDADINTAVIDLLEGLLIAGTTKAEGFVAVINFLADSANADHPDLGDIAQAFQNRADAAEYFSITKELGDSSDADLAAAIALVTSDAATLTAANAAADATASSAAPVASQTLTLTTGVETISGTIANETINAPAASATTGAAATTLDSGDVIDGGAGTDTLNITMTATNNNSLAGVTVKNVEKVYVTGANFQTSGATGAALATATAAKAATAASLTAAQAAVVTSQSQDNAADAVVVLATEGAIARAATATVASAAADVAALTALTDTTLFADAATINTAAASSTAIGTAYTTTLSAEHRAAFTLAQFTAAINATQNDGAGAAPASSATRAAALLAEAIVVENAVKSTAVDAATALQQKSAADVVAGMTGVDIDLDLALDATLTASYTALSPAQKASFSIAQYTAALTAAVTAEDGTTLTGTGVGGTIETEATAEAARAATLNTYENNQKDFTLAELNAAATAALKSATGSSLVTGANDSVNVLARANALATASAAAVTAADTEAAKAVVADNTAASALTVATAAAAAVSDASLSGASFAGSTEVWMVGANSNKTDLTVTTQAAGLSGVTGLDNKITFGATGTLAVIGSSGTVDIAGAAGGLTIGGTGTAGTGLTLKNTAGTTAATGVKALTVDTSSSAVLNLANLGQLTSVTSTGKGGVTIASPSVKVATILTGEGNDRVAVKTQTAKDNTTTAADETISADVVTGAGNDTVNINTSSDGVTSVATGAGKDTVYVSAVSTGTASVTTGEGDDTVDITAVALGTYPSLTVGAGDGTDTLVTAGASFTAVDYLRMNTALSDFEAITFTSAVGALDVSKLAIGSVGALNFQAGVNVVTKVAGQTLTLTGASALAAASADGITPAKAAITGGQNLDASAAGYLVGLANTYATNYAGSLSVSSKSNNTSIIDVHAESATIGVIAAGGSDTAAYAQTVQTTGSDVKSLTVNLSSAQGSGTNVENEYLATFNAGTVTDTLAGGYGEHLEALSSLTVTGAGVFTINTSGVNLAALVKLTTIDLSGMSAIANLNDLGLVADTSNKATTTVTLNDLASETVLLGGARDTIVTNSKVAVMDTISGFQLTASANPLLADTTRSDVLDVPGAGGFAKFTSTTATTFAGILTEAGSSAVGDSLVFHFGGDTYVYQDTGANGLDDLDIVVKLVGTLDLDQMITTGVIA